jgi:hypothetical protein
MDRPNPPYKEETMQNPELQIFVLSALALLFAGGFTALLLIVLRNRRQWTAWIIAAGVLSTCGGMWFISPESAGIMLVLVCAWGLPVLIAGQIIVEKDTEQRIRKYEKGLESLREEYRD